MDKFEIWSKWEAVPLDDDYSAKRIKSAQAAKLTPIRINADDCYGHFTGKHGNYETFLDYCPCGDFFRAKRPCKHIFRLAMELGILDVPFKSDVSKIVPPEKETVAIEECVDFIETLTDEFQKELKDALYEMTQNDGYGVCSAALASDLISKEFFEPTYNVKSFLLHIDENELLNLLSPIFPNYNKHIPKSEAAVSLAEKFNQAEIENIFKNYKVVTLPYELKNNLSKMYKYLHRKFDTNTFFSDKTCQFEDLPYLETDLPDDIITSLLVKNGYYDLTKHSVVPRIHVMKIELNL